MAPWLHHIFAWANSYFSHHQAFFSNAGANAVGTILGGLLLTLLYFVFGQYVLRPPQLSGSWSLETTVEHTDYNPFRGMLVRYKLLVVQNGLSIVGTAEKTYERSRQGEVRYIGAKRDLLTLRGAVQKNYVGRSRLTLHMYVDGAQRKSSVFFALTCKNFGTRTKLTGAFSHTAADSYGIARCLRVPLDRRLDEYHGLPLRWVARVFEFATKGMYAAAWERLSTELDRYEGYVRPVWQTYNLFLPVAALVVAEDRRFYRHGGIDPIAILRAAWSTLIRGKIQGASTIEQQLVRVLTHDYRRSFRRKFKELVLAARLHKKLPKDQIPLVYLYLAYFGWRMNGIGQAASRLGIDMRDPTANAAAALVARIRFPEAEHPTAVRQQEIAKRQAWILRELRARPHLAL